MFGGKIARLGGTPAINPGNSRVRSRVEQGPPGGEPSFGNSRPLYRGFGNAVLGG